jgi:hypothetical protein
MYFLFQLQLWKQIQKENEMIQVMNILSDDNDSQLHDDSIFANMFNALFFKRFKF